MDSLWLEPDFLIVRRQCRQGRSPVRIGPALVRHQSFESDAAMRTDAAEFDFSLVEKLDQRRPGNVQHVCCFLSGEFGSHWNERDGIPARHLLKNVDQHLYCGGRNLYRLLAGIVDHSKPQRLGGLRT